MSEVYARECAAEEAAAESWINAVKLGQTAIASQIINTPELAKAKLDGRLLELALRSNVYAAVVNLVIFVPEIASLAMERARDTANSVLCSMLMALASYGTTSVDDRITDTTEPGIYDYA